MIKRSERFYASKEMSGTYKLLRISYGILSLATLLVIRPLIPLFFGAESLCPLPLLADKGSFLPFSLFSLINSELFIWITWSLGLLCAGAITVGRMLRAALVGQFIILSAFFISPCNFDNYGDQIFMGTAFLMMFLPRKNPWLRYTFLIYLSTLYMAPIIFRVSGYAWWDGSAVWTALADPLTSRISDYLLTQPERWPAWLFSGLTYFSLSYEISFPLLIWWKPARLYLIIIGILFHLGMAIPLKLGLFPFYMSFLILAALSDSQSYRILIQKKRAA